ncbi:hypothetical protein [Pontibacter sp. G13]|uniref:hypothetical protein n=1 Tax=Pontibacter sp. G13 TaxID=3074898 RepID=UPI00288C25F4|nr:hypothetical protein [Pontibacter sp. G13]WNJ16159.1 hypothetical protein RJD25_14950 [Pontibacter sp. G13]
MTRVILLACSLLVLIAPQVAAQQLTLSPFSRYGIGDIFGATSVRNAGMAGIGAGTDNFFTINRLNPASYADLVFTTAEISVYGQYTNFETSNSSANSFTGGFHDAAFAFPSKYVTFVLGFAPYSAVGYDLEFSRTLESNENLIEGVQYKADGGLNQAFFGAGFRLLDSRLKIGANFQYIFGNTEYTWRSTLIDTANTSSVFRTIGINQDVFVNGINLQGGITYTDTLSSAKNTLFRIGAVYEHNFGLRGDRFTTYNNVAVLDTLRNLEEGDIVLPDKLTAGFSIFKRGHWTVGADVTYQDWTNFEYFSDSASLNQSLGPELRFALGGEIIPNYSARGYLKRIAYRFGVYYEQSYIELADQAVEDYGFSVGFGLPAGLKGNSRLNPGRGVSRINLAFQLGRRGNLVQNDLLEELYASIRLGFSLNERWFVKRVVD